MFVTFRSSSPCALCGFRFRILMCVTVRVNKRTLRGTGTMIGALGEHRCPECGWPNRGEMMPRSPYVLDPEDAVKVAEYRKRRFGIDEPDAVAIERAS